MPHGRPPHALAGAAAAVVVVTLVGCSSAPPARTTPNAVERAAVQHAVGYEGISPVDLDIPWVQLWTVRQFDGQMQKCAGEASHGQLQLDLGPYLSGRVSYRLLGSATHPNEAEASAIIEECRRRTPVDDRILRLDPVHPAAIYSYDLTVLRPCLISHGFSSGAAPTRDQFERQLAAELPWSPYDEVEVGDRLAWYAISDACPALPPAFAASTAP